MMFLDHTQRRNTVGRTPMDEWSAQTQRPLPDNTQTYMPPGWIWTHNLSRRAAAKLCLRPRGYWDGFYPNSSAVCFV